MERRTLKVYILLAAMLFCVILVPLIAYLIGEWYAYWGHAILAIVFSLIAVYIKTHYYWEEEQ
ncbi:MAG: hypothetical protein ACPL0C_03560 [Candidatus Bathyarchaeales archaeon]